MHLLVFAQILGIVETVKTLPTVVEKVELVR